MRHVQTNAELGAFHRAGGGERAARLGNRFVGPAGRDRPVRLWLQSDRMRAGGAAVAAAGRGSRDIANELFISPKTASVHVSNILGKLGAASGGEAAAKAHVLRLLETLCS
jgi:hypothetical protein